MKNIPLLVGTILGTLLLIIGVAYFFSGSGTPEEVQTVDQNMLVADARHVYGPAEAAVTIVEFSDLQCPACRATQPLVKQLKSEYGDKVKFVYRHFPLDSIHPNARMAAQASELVAEQGKFFEFTELLYTRQEEWAEITSKEDLLNKFVEYAQSLELEIDKDTFLEKIESQEVAQKVAGDVAIGDAVQVNSTPTFFVNGVKTPAPQLQTAVESATSQQ